MTERMREQLTFLLDVAKRIGDAKLQATCEGALREEPLAVVEAAILINGFEALFAPAER